MENERKMWKYGGFRGNSWVSAGVSEPTTATGDAAGWPDVVRLYGAEPSLPSASTVRCPAAPSGGRPLGRPEKRRLPEATRLRAW